MPEFKAEIDIDPSEFVSDCSSSEIDELIEILHEEGHLTNYFREYKLADPDSCIIPEVEDPNLLDIEWNRIVAKLSRNRLMLTKEEEEIITEISKRLI